jgi:hypothetical protein
LVEDAPVVVVGLHVGGVAVARRIEADVQVLPDVVVAGGGAGESFFDAAQLVADVVLLGLRRLRGMAPA